MMKYKIVVCIFGHIGKIEEYMRHSHLNHVIVFENHPESHFTHFTTFEKSENYQFSRTKSTLQSIDEKAIFGEAFLVNFQALCSVH